MGIALVLAFAFARLGFSAPDFRIRAVCFRQKRTFSTTPFTFEGSFSFYIVGSIIAYPNYDGFG